MLQDFLDVHKCLQLDELPSYEFLSLLLDKASSLLEEEVTPYRPVSSNGQVGGLLDFTTLEDDLPVIVVPDIHARPDFLLNILEYKLPVSFLPDSINEKNDQTEMTVETALSKKLIHLICVGDAIHTELTSTHWEKIQEEFDENNFTGPEMQEEMKNCLSVLCGIMSLKLLYPESFHFLKGNHENILNESTGGDCAFCKYADEGEMVKIFISEYYGDDILYLISCWEGALPLAATGKKYVISHSEPAKVFTRQKLIDARFYDDVVFGLIWTRSGLVKEPSVEGTFNNLHENKCTPEDFYFVGHTPIHEMYRLKQNGRLVQIHNPRKQNIVLFPNSDFRVFNPDIDIVGVKNDE